MARGSIHRTARETHPPHGDARETINRNARETHRTARETHRAATRETINRNARETIDRNARETINRNAREPHRAALRPGFPSVTPGWCVRSRRSRLRRCMISSRFARFWERRAAPGAIRTPARGDSGNPGHAAAPAAHARCCARRSRTLLRPPLTRDPPRRVAPGVPVGHPGLVCAVASESPPTLHDFLPLRARLGTPPRRDAPSRAAPAPSRSSPSPCAQ